MGRARAAAPTGDGRRVRRVPGAPGPRPGLTTISTTRPVPAGRFGTKVPRAGARPSEVIAPSTTNGAVHELPLSVGDAASQRRKTATLPLQCRERCCEFGRAQGWNSEPTSRPRLTNRPPPVAVQEFTTTKTAGRPHDRSELVQLRVGDLQALRVGIAEGDQQGPVSGHVDHAAQTPPVVTDPVPHRVRLHRGRCAVLERASWRTSACWGTVGAHLSSMDPFSRGTGRTAARGSRTSRWRPGRTRREGSGR